MKAKFLKCIVSCALILVMICGYTVNVSAADMAYNIYSDPNLQGETQFDTYMIDFKSTQTPYYTYWALANFQLYLSPQTQNLYRGISGGGGYAGLQDRGPAAGRGHSAIMSFWEWTYSSGGKSTILRATRMYPEPWTGDSEFTGEGEGTNWITPYDWKDNQWYRMVIHTWTDRATGRTFMGQWFQDLTTGEWTLISYFNTQLVNSCLTGNMHFFRFHRASSAIDAPPAPAGSWFCSLVVRPSRILAPADEALKLRLVLQSGEVFALDLDDLCKVLFRGIFQNAAPGLPAGAPLVIFRIPRVCRGADLDVRQAVTVKRHFEDDRSGLIPDKPLFFRTGEVSGRDSHLACEILPDVAHGGAGQLENVVAGEVDLALINDVSLFDLDHGLRGAHAGFTSR